MLLLCIEKGRKTGKEERAGKSVEGEWGDCSRRVEGKGEERQRGKKGILGEEKAIIESLE